MYVHIITANDTEVEETARDLFNEDYRKCIEYLAQWDAGVDSEFPDAIEEELERHHLDRFYTEGEYTLIENPYYISMYRKL